MFIYIYNIYIYIQVYNIYHQTRKTKFMLFTLGHRVFAFDSVPLLPFEFRHQLHKGPCKFGRIDPDTKSMYKLENQSNLYAIEIPKSESYKLKGEQLEKVTFHFLNFKKLRLLQSTGSFISLPPTAIYIFLTCLVFTLYRQKVPSHGSQIQLSYMMAVGDTQSSFRGWGSVLPHPKDHFVNLSQTERNDVRRCKG